MIRRALEAELPQCLRVIHGAFGTAAEEFGLTPDNCPTNGAARIHTGIIEENERLKRWYLANGFVHMGTRVFPHLPFTVGFLEMVCGG